MKKKEERKQKRIVNKLSQQKKKAVQGCIIQKIDPKDYEDCVEHATNEDAKYSSSAVSKDAVIDELLRQKIEENKMKQANVLLYDLYRKKSEIPLPPGKLKQLKQRPDAEINKYFLDRKIEELKKEKEMEEGIQDKYKKAMKYDLKDYEDILLKYAINIKDKEEFNKEYAKIRNNREIGGLRKSEALQLLALIVSGISNKEKWMFDEQELAKLSKDRDEVLAYLLDKYNIKPKIA